MARASASTAIARSILRVITPRRDTATSPATAIPAPPPPPSPEPPAPARAQGPSPDDDSAPLTGGFRAQVDRLEASLLLRALRDARGSQAEAARILDIPLRTLQHRLKAHGIRKGGYEGPPPKG